MRSLLVAVTLLVTASSASADDASGRGAGIGFVVGMSGDYTLILGWELSGTLNPLVKGAVGGSYYVGREEREPAAVHYLVYEPWLVLGGTVGVAVTDELEPRFAYGMWEGAPLVLNGNLTDDPNDEGGQQVLMLTFAIGWRGFGRTYELYFTPKIWTYRGYDFFS